MQYFFMKKIQNCTTKFSKVEYKFKNIQCVLKVLANFEQGWCSLGHLTFFLYENILYGFVKELLKKNKDLGIVGSIIPISYRQN